MKEPASNENMVLHNHRNIQQQLEADEKAKKEEAAKKKEGKK